MVVKILTGWQSSRSWLYILATVKRMCLKWFYASGYCPFFPPHKIILKPMFPVLGTSLLPSACCAEQVHPRIAFALGLQLGCMETQDISANTASGSMGEEMEQEVDWDLGGSPSPVMLKPVLLSPSDVTSI